MINLLPEDTKQDLRAARANVALLRYNFITLIAIGVLAIFCGLFYFFLGISQSAAASKSSDNTAKAASYAEVRKQAEEYRSNLAIANQVLGSGVNYTSVIFSISELVPKGVILDNLTINAANFGQQTTFSAKAKTYADATKLKESFQKSPLFSNVFLQSVSDTSGGETTGPYPVSVMLSAKLNKTTP